MKSKEMTPLQKLAKEYSRYFRTAIHRNGDEFRELNEYAPKELVEIVYLIRDGICPDDYKYKFVEAALIGLAASADPDGIIVKPDSNPIDLYKWFESGRSFYVNRSFEQYGLPAQLTIEAILAQGQFYELHEVLLTVRGALERILRSRKRGK